MRTTRWGFAVLWALPVLAGVAAACNGDDPGPDADASGDDAVSGADEAIGDGGGEDAADDEAADEAIDDGGGEDATADEADDDDTDDAGTDETTGDEDADDSADDADGGPDADGGATCRVPADCQDGLFCNGYEACAPGSAGADTRGCVPGELPCAGACEEAAGRCTPGPCDVGRCTSSGDCNDGVTCNGVESCATDGTCLPGTPIDCSARPGDVCLEPFGRCFCPVTGCDDGLFCNGLESCGPYGCEPGSAPCASASSCNETLDACRCSGSADCSDGVYCNGFDLCGLDRLCTTIPVACPVGDTCMEGLDMCGDCTGPSDCSDGLSCNGSESCTAGRCSPPGPCGAPDADGDGVDSIEFGGLDCDDTDPARYPGAAEVCDAIGKDEDCDPLTIGARDGDRDGFVDHNCCNGGSCGDDCEDFVRTTNPAAMEECNLVDDDCDTRIDEGLEVTSYRDRDGDGSGDPDCTEPRCLGSAGWALLGNDCDDTRPAVHHGSRSCDPSGSGVRACTDGAWGVTTACSPGTSCRPQSDGSGLCI
ncbi:MAG: putative metal-binding motif-containing protein [Deltaproteobacteria bacterium]|nr:putative metal-binding motif-containing protein [Deltaproteobacteria bacterium]